jgi:glycosyltransferase involved in cell wall biosynthesis
MRLLLALKLTSDSLMVAEATALRNAPNVTTLNLLTDSDYGTQVESVQYHFLKSSIAKIPIVRVFARIPKMIRICREKKIDLLVCYHLTSYGFAGFIVSKILGIPLSLHFLGKDIDVLCQKPILGPLLLWYAKKVGFLTVQGSNSKAFLESKGLRNIHIVPTACDLSKFRPSGNQKKDYDVIFLGRLGREKRVDRFVDIVHMVHKRGFSLTAAVVGSGPEEKKMLDKIRNLGLLDSIKYVGWTNNVADYLGRSRIFLLTSDSDQLPSTLIEAMAMGVVPIASNVGNVSDVVGNETGFLIDRNDTNSFADSVIALLTDNEIYSKMSHRAQEKAKSFSLEANSKRWERILNTIEDQH